MFIDHGLLGCDTLKVKIMQWNIVDHLPTRSHGVSHKPEDHYQHLHCHENFKSEKVILGSKNIQTYHYTSCTWCFAFCIWKKNAYQVKYDITSWINYFININILLVSGLKFKLHGRYFISSLCPYIQQCDATKIVAVNQFDCQDAKNRMYALYINVRRHALLWLSL
jgi:hypothetical protein